MEKLKTVLSLVSALGGRAILFHAIMENGAIFYRLPISALFNEALNPKTFLNEDLMNWSFGILLVIILLLLLGIFLSAASGKYIGKDKKWHHGQYLFTVDWAHPDGNILDTDHSEIPHEHKCAHIIALDDGNYAAQPNNRCIWDLPSFTVKDNIPDWKVQTNDVER